MNAKVFIVDSFSAKPFSGNPAGVVALNERMSDAWMQAVAKEINLSETAFVLEQGGRYLLRWFTPTTEVALCGHATLATAYVLFERLLSAEFSEVSFDTISGPIHCHQKDGFIWMRFPKFNFDAIDIHDDISHAFGSAPEEVLKTGENIMAIFDDSKIIIQCIPDLEQIRRIGGQGVIISSRAPEEGFDFISRYFAPNIGIPEDPVTGSSHSSLAPYWAERLGKQQMIAKQVSARGGIIKVNVLEQAIEIGGMETLVIAGELFP
jgi:PhzF family phenazine biosynthesis protein